MKRLVETGVVRRPRMMIVISDADAPPATTTTPAKSKITSTNAGGIPIPPVPPGDPYGPGSPAPDPNAQ